MSGIVEPARAVADRSLRPEAVGGGVGPDELAVRDPDLVVGRPDADPRGSSSPWRDRGGGASTRAGSTSSPRAVSARSTIRIRSVAKRSSASRMNSNSSATVGMVGPQRRDGRQPTPVRRPRRAAARSQRRVSVIAPDCTGRLEPPRIDTGRKPVYIVSRYNVLRYMELIVADPAGTWTVRRAVAVHPAVAQRRAEARLCDHARTSRPSRARRSGRARCMARSPGWSSVASSKPWSRRTAAGRIG